MQIFRDCVLYAAPFSKLNDIDECRYRFFNGSDINAYENYLLKEKRYICSFSKENINKCQQELMWAHYANSHCGIKIDFKIDIDILLKIIEEHDKVNGTITTCKIYPVTYDDIPPNCNDNEEFINELDKIMTNKQDYWSYEGEYRAIFNTQDAASDDKYLYLNNLPIIIDKITLGKGFSDRIIGGKEDEEESYEPHIIDIARRIINIWSKGVGGKLGYTRPKIVGYKSRYSNVSKYDILDENYNNINIR